MKRTRLLAVALAVCLCVGMMAPAASAAETPFNDIAGHWAQAYLMDMYNAGLFNGYGDGTIRPNDLVKNAEALALCARILHNKDVRAQIAADQEELLNELFPVSTKMPADWWFRKEAATCIVTGIADAETLAWMASEDTLSQPMTKADFAMYVVRGVGLEELARSLNASELPFNDEASIAERYRPYIKVLSSYGVVEGDDQRNFNPDQPMSRAVCATMLSRAIDHIVEERKVNVELPQYTKYAWTSGAVVEVEPAENGGRIMTIRSEITGEETVVLPAATTVYQYNKEDQFTALKTGAFVKVRYADDGKTVESVRVTPADQVTKAEGACGRITTDSVTVNGKEYAMDRFTQVSAGGRKGDRSVIDYAANYTDAQAGVDIRGRVLWLKLSGGTRLAEGVLTDVTVETIGLTERISITVKGYNGVTTTYNVPETAAVTVNGQKARFMESQEGRQITLRVSDADLSEVKAAEVNLNDRFLQGILRAVNTKNDPVRVELRLDGESRSTNYDVSADCAVTYRGDPSELAKLPQNSFVTAKLEGGTITALYAWQGYESTEGTLTAISFSDPTVLEVTRADNTAVRFSIPVERMGSVAFTTGNKDGKVNDLRTGDKVVVTVLYNDVTQVDYTHQAANISGTLSAISYATDGSVRLTLTFSTGATQAYTATNTTSVVQGGKPVAIADLAAHLQSQVSLVTEGEQVVSVEITGTVTRTDKITGSIFSKDDQGRIATLLVVENGKNRLMDVRIPSGAKIITADGADLRSIAQLNVGDVIEVRGAVASDGVFEARSVIRE